MKKIFLILLGLCLFQFIGADIAENFEPSGLELLGSGFIRLINSFEEFNPNINLTLGLSKFIMKGLSISMVLGGEYSPMYLSSFSSLGMRYHFIIPDGNKGFAAALGLMCAFNFTPNNGYSDTFAIATRIEASGYFFFNDRAAFFISPGLNVMHWLYTTATPNEDEYGMEDFLNLDDLTGSFQVLFGISYFIPGKKKINI